MPVRNLACQVSSRGDQFEGSQYLELTEVTSLEDLHNKLKTALSINLHESITVEAWDVDFDEWCQLHDVDVCPEKPNLRISRGIKIDPDAPHERRRFSKRDRSLSAREALPSPSYTKRFAPDSADQPQHHPQPKTVVYNGLMFVAGMPKRHTGQAQKVSPSPHTGTMDVTKTASLDFVFVFVHPHIRRTTRPGPVGGPPRKTSAFSRQWASRGLGIGRALLPTCRTGTTLR